MNSEFDEYYYNFDKEVLSSRIEEISFDKGCWEAYNVSTSIFQSPSKLLGRNRSNINNDDTTSLLDPCENGEMNFPHKPKGGPSRIVSYDNYKINNGKIKNSSKYRTLSTHPVIGRINHKPPVNAIDDLNRVINGLKLALSLNLNSKQVESNKIKKRCNDKVKQREASAMDEVSISIATEKSTILSTSWEESSIDNKNWVDFHDSSVSMNLSCPSISLQQSSSSLFVSHSFSMSPEEYFDAMIYKRGYSTERYAVLKSGYHNEPTQLQEVCYTSYVLKLVRLNDITTLHTLLRSGMSNNPCTSFGESLAHYVCRLGRYEILKMMIEFGCDIRVSDVSGSTLLHELCRSKFKPSRKLLDLIIKEDARLFHLKDTFGAVPLSYVPRKYWILWNEYFESRKETFWPVRDCIKFGQQPPPPLTTMEQNTRILPAGKIGVDLETLEKMCSGQVKPESLMSKQEHALHNMSTLNHEYPTYAMSEDDTGSVLSFPTAWDDYITESTSFEATKLDFGLIENGQSPIVENCEGDSPVGKEIMDTSTGGRSISTYSSMVSDVLGEYLCDNRVWRAPEEQSQNSFFYQSMNNKKLIEFETDCRIFDKPNGYPKVFIDSDDENSIFAFSATEANNDDCKSCVSNDSFLQEILQRLPDLNVSQTGSCMTPIDLVEIESLISTDSSTLKTPQGVIFNSKRKEFKTRTDINEENDNTITIAESIEMYGENSIDLVHDEPELCGTPHADNFSTLTCIAHISNKTISKSTRNSLKKSHFEDAVGHFHESSYYFDFAIKKYGEPGTTKTTPTHLKDTDKESHPNDDCTISTTDSKGSIPEHVINYDDTNDNELKSHPFYGARIHV